MVKHRTRKHQLPQTGKKPYKCDHCGKPYEKNLSSLQLEKNHFPMMVGVKNRTRKQQLPQKPGGKSTTNVMIVAND